MLVNMGFQPENPGPLASGALSSHFWKTFQVKALTFKDGDHILTISTSYVKEEEREVVLRDIIDSKTVKPNAPPSCAAFLEIEVCEGNVRCKRQFRLRASFHKLLCCFHVLSSVLQVYAIKNFVQRTATALSGSDAIGLSLLSTSATRKELVKTLCGIVNSSSLPQDR